MKKRLKGIAALATALVMVLATLPAASAAEVTSSFSKRFEGYICQGNLSMTDTRVSASFTAQESSGALSEFAYCEITAGTYTINSNGTLNITNLFVVSGELQCSGSGTYSGADRAIASYKFLGSNLETLKVSK